MKGPSLIFVVGPTASGKTDCALDIAESLNASIVNADSIQLYEGLVIGSSAPTIEQKRRAPHELFQVIPKGKTWTVGEYEEQAFKAVEKYHSQNKPVVVVGGSGFYIQALEKGVSVAPPDDPNIRESLYERLESEGEDILYRELQACDPETAKHVHPRDHYRVIRALSYFLSFKRPFSADKFNSAPRVWPGPVLKIGFRASQEELKERIQIRTRSMLEEGFIDEVSKLLGEGLGEWWPLKSVGYFEVTQFLAGAFDRKDLERQIVQKTLLLAKKQKTWFQRDKDIQWFSLGEKKAAHDLILDLSRV